MSDAPAPAGVPAPDAAPLDQIFAEVSPRSVGGMSLFSPLPSDGVNPATVVAFHSEPGDQREAVTRLKALGFVVHHPEASPITLSISGPPELYKQVFGVDFAETPATAFSMPAQPDRDGSTQPYLAPVGDQHEFYAEPPRVLAGSIEGVVFPQPHEFHALSATPPAVPYYHLNVPDDVARLLHADQVHARQITGQGVRVAMVDSGHYRHPYFIERGYTIKPVLLAADAADSDPTRDESGHGTMMSANLFATAPGITLIPVKSLLRDTAAAFNVALAQNPHIITCSWGLCMRENTTGCAGNVRTALPLNERPLQAAIADAVRRGIVVVFSAGNGHISWPAMHPDVIAVGGAYVDEQGAVQASNYASSFISPIFSDRPVPDIVGLVGQLPHATYILLPGPPGCDLDRLSAGSGPYPAGDGTAPDDGWAVLSGTSAAAPQIAGIAALLLQTAPGLAPPVVKNLLRRAGRDVAAGRTNPACEDAPPGPHPALPGPDLATGNGLVDAYQVYSLGRLHAFLAPEQGLGVGGRGLVDSTSPTPALAAEGVQDVTVPAGGAEVQLRLTVRVEVTGIAPGPGNGAAVTAPEAAAVPEDAILVQALQDPAIRRLVLEALDTAPPALRPSTLDAQPPSATRPAPSSEVQ